MTSGFNHELELDEFAGTAPRSPPIVGDSCPERTLSAQLLGAFLVVRIRPGSSHQVVSARHDVVSGGKGAMAAPGA